ncbi:hypothetical protein HPB47_000115 [Ixodes persulcatus]|uniref:Uncharacterized protein n=1 Tax=Ixodes persulcatus TaxID=34615 RepID=A0AC60PSM1_IXOPE|nr:hypothetical protein HPB47_000115 [Ixodes persulcatus]
MSLKRRALSFKEKLEVLRKVDQDPKRKHVDLAKELGPASSTLQMSLLEALHFVAVEPRHSKHYLLGVDDLDIENWEQLGVEGSARDLIAADDDLVTYGRGCR